MHPNRTTFRSQQKVAIDTADILGISTISAWEIGMLVQKGRLSLKYEVHEWIERVGSLPKITWMPLDTKIAVVSTCLPGNFHGDPADRIITQRHSPAVFLWLQRIGGFWSTHMCRLFGKKNGTFSLTDCADCVALWTIPLHNINQKPIKSVH
jgi:PIN domain nuclease of toxin-antitoxin system